jgi:hypothetical protein
MKKLLPLLLFGIISLTSFAQKEWKYFPYYHYVPNLGYAWQGINTYEAGLRLLPFTKAGAESFAVIGNGILFKRDDITYVSPELMLRYNKPLKGIMHGTLNASMVCSYWTSKVLGEREHRITPEIGVSLGIIAVTYGYNIPISENELSFFSRHRIAVRLFSL